MIIFSDINWLHTGILFRAVTDAIILCVLNFVHYVCDVWRLNAFVGYLRSSYVVMNTQAVAMGSSESSDQVGILATQHYLLI